MNKAILYSHSVNISVVVVVVVLDVVVVVVVAFLLGLIFSSHLDRVV